MYLTQLKDDDKYQIKENQETPYFFNTKDKKNREILPEWRQKDQETLAKQRDKHGQFFNEVIESLQATKVKNDEIQILTENYRKG